MCVLKMGKGGAEKCMVSLGALSFKRFTYFSVNCNFENSVNQLKLSESIFFFYRFDDEDGKLDICNYSEMFRKTYSF